jgi:hypothetical protein
VRLTWKGKNGGHVFNFEVDGGRVRFVDGQNGSVDVGNYFDDAEPNTVRWFRSDGLEPSNGLSDWVK